MKFKQFLFSLSRDIKCFIFAKVQPKGQFIRNFNVHYQDVQKEQNMLGKFIEKNHIKVKSVIDIACGNGIITKKLQQLLKLNLIFGLDINKTLLDKAKENGIKTILMDFKTMNLKNKFDLVISYGSLHHFENTKGLIMDLKKLSKNYILIVDSTVRKTLYHRITGSKHFPLEFSPYRIRTKEEIILALKQAKCKIIDVKTNLNANIWHDRTFFLVLA